PEHPVPTTMVVNLHGYQRQALSWLIKRENQSGPEPTPATNDPACASETPEMCQMDPLWTQYNFAKSSLIHQKSTRGRPFYFHKHTGQLSLKFPRINNRYCGGILADEMGLGKTIEVLSLIHATFQPGDTHLAPSQPPLPHTDPSIGPDLIETPATLIVCPMSLMSQWRDEAKLFSQPGSIQVDIYYGPSRNLSFLQDPDRHASKGPLILITSYNTLLADYMQWNGEGAVGKSNCRSIFRYRFHRIVLDEAHTIKSRNTKTFKACDTIQATRRWAVTGTPITNRLDDYFSLLCFLRFEPWCRTLVWKTTISDPIQKNQHAKQPLNVAQLAILQKDAEHAFRILRSILRQTLLRRTKNLILPSGKPLVVMPPICREIQYVTLSETEQALYAAVQTDSKRKFGNLCAQGMLWRNYAHIFQLLSRLRLGCCHPQLLVDNLERAGAIVDSPGRDQGVPFNAPPLPGWADDTVTEVLDKQKLYGSSTVTPTIELSTECPVCFESLTYQREEAESDQPVAADDPGDDSTRPEDASTSSSILLPCHHIVCVTCWAEYCERQGDSGLSKRCPLCRFEPIRPLSVFTSMRAVISPHRSVEEPCLTREFVNGIDCTSSAKLESLLTYLKHQVQADPSRKSVVFSQFTSFLQVLVRALTAEGIQFVLLDGSLSHVQRERVLHTFKNDPNCTVFLLSLRAGGTGLNLTCASRVFLMDPWWNTAIESQAIDRVYRLGQSRPVDVVRFIVKGSVEERMLEIQQSK
ncbi:SNF2 family N-terminal domain-containing protein, partial [Dimargaris cristalligena]